MLSFNFFLTFFICHGFSCDRRQTVRPPIADYLICLFFFGPDFGVPPHGRPRHSCVVVPSLRGVTFVRGALFSPLFFHLRVPIFLSKRFTDEFFFFCRFFSLPQTRQAQSSTRVRGQATESRPAVLSRTSGSSTTSSSAGRRRQCRCKKE